MLIVKGKNSKLIYLIHTSRRINAGKRALFSDALLLSGGKGVRASDKLPPKYYQETVPSFELVSVNNKKLHIFSISLLDFADQLCRPRYGFGVSEVSPTEVKRHSERYR